MCLLESGKVFGSVARLSRFFFTFLPFDTMSASRPGTPSFLRDNNDPPTYDFRRMDYYLDASQGHEPESTVIERSVAYIVSMPRSGTKVMRNSSHFASLLHGCAWFDLPGSCRLSFFFRLEVSVTRQTKQSSWFGWISFCVLGGCEVFLVVSLLLLPSLGSLFPSGCVEADC